MSDPEALKPKNLKDILESLPDGIIGHDRDRKITYVNRAAEEIAGCSRHDILGKDCHEAFGAPFCGKHCAFLEKIPRSRVHSTYSLNVVTLSGEPKQLAVSVSSISNDEDQIIGHTAMLRDVSDLAGLKVWEAGDGYPGIVGRHPSMVHLFRKIHELANFDYPALITGETGTGKELVAHALHSESRRADGPFVAVNCGALPESLAESELFGHVKGAFSGAIRDKRGRFELAHNGTLFLDEVADLPKAIQVKILRILETGACERLGSEKIIRVDVRIISATNRDLKREVETGNFREDLFYRLNVVPLQVPPLRQRKDDIPLLINHFLDQAGQEGHKAAGFSQEAGDLLLAYDWPGNVRELRSVVQYALASRTGLLIQPEDLPAELRAVEPLGGFSKKLDKEAVQAALAQCGGNKTKAAQLLGIGRATLYRFLSSAS